MDLIKCPRCGEEFSPSYRKCPFCEEGDHPRRRVKYGGGKKSGGRRVSDRKRTQSAGGAVTAVLVVVLMLLSWSLFGDRIVAKIGGSGTNDTEQTDDAAQIGGEVVLPDDAGENDGTETEDDTGDAPVPPETDGEDSPNTSTETTDSGTSTAVDVSALSVKTSVGTTLPKDANGSFDCTIGPNDSIRLSVSGTDAAVTWTAADTSVLTVSSDGKLSPLKTGTTTVTASVGGAALTIIVRIK